MKPNISITEVRNNLSQLGKAMRALTEQDVFIGIPEDKTAREAAGDTGISNAYLGYIHEHGVPEKNIPPRPHLMPGIEDIQDEAADLLEYAAKHALEGKPEAVERTLNKIGILGQNAVRARFVNNDWDPLADSTLDYQPLRKNDQGAVLTDKKGNPKRKKSRRERERTNPLIDTSQLRKAYTHVIRKRGNTALVVT
ncbi:MAG: hypothetical protein FWG04_02630 [Desulfovibrionaceae bacterium]|nr:hypothetical protein [Desulfovibrionaceae bacterium]